MTFSTIILFTILSLLPILGWLWFFQKKQPEKRSAVIISFVAGMIAVLPIKLYEKYWNTAIGYFEHINIFTYIAELVDIPSLPRLMAFITIHAIVALGLFLFTAKMMMLLEVFTKDNTLELYKQKVKKIWEAPAFFIVIGAICGVIAYFVSTNLSQTIWFFVIVGMLEEFTKHLVLRFTDDEKIKSVDDALEFSIIVALGFVFIENILYFEKIWNQSFTGLVFFSFVILRSSVSAMAHICFSGILGYFYGIARFSNEIYQQTTQKSKNIAIKYLNQILHLKETTLFHEEKMMEGMILAMTLHAIFNALLEYGKTTIALPLLFLLFWITIKLFHTQNTNIAKKSLIFYPLKQR